MQVSARLGWQVSEQVEIQTGILGAVTNTRFDDWGVDNRFDRERDATGQVWLKGQYTTPDGSDKTSLTTFANRTMRRTGYDPNTYYDWNLMALAPNKAAQDYRGDRYGSELQHDHRWAKNYGITIVGVRTENESLHDTHDYITRLAPVVDDTGSQTTNSAYLMHRLPVGQRFVFSLGGRIDNTDHFNTFSTWRATTAYSLDETGTKFRASVGTGAKAPTLYQLMSFYGYNKLQPENSIGFDVGIDQDLPRSLGSTSVSLFYNKYRDLISFGPVDHCTTAQINDVNNGCYYNVNRAQTKGVESSLDLIFFPGILKSRSSYTFTLAQNLATHTALFQRPQHQGIIGLVYTGIHDLEIEPRVVMVGHRVDYGSQRLAPYARLDLLSNYKISETLTGYMRMENLTNAHYQVVHDFGTAGRSVLLGLKAKW